MKINCKYIGNILLGAAAFIISASFLTSCDDGYEVKKVVPTLDIQESVAAGPLDSRQIVKLRSSYPWYAEASDPWIDMQRYRGQALKKDSLVFNIAENESMDDREGWIEIRLMDQMSQRIPVKQSGRGTLITLGKKLVRFNVNGGETVVDVLTHLDWDTDIKDEDGFKFTKVDESKLKVIVGKNTTGAERSKKVTLKDKNGNETAQLNVIQSNVEKMLSITLPVKDKDILLPKAKVDNIDIPVSLNLDYDCVVSDGSWIKVIETPAFSGDIVMDITVKIALEANTTGVERSGYVKIKDKNTDMADIFYVSQMGRDRRIYVKPGGIGDGSDWDNAFGNLPDAIAASDRLYEIWVAKGDYQLSKTLTWPCVNMYGGFSGDETKLKDRDLNNKSTIKGGNFITISAWGNKVDKEYFYMDGFILTGADSKNEYMGPFEIYKYMGFRNCVFCDNTYGKNGGGYFEGVKFFNCVFYNNKTLHYSAAINVKNAELYNVTIVNNIGKNEASGGGVRIGGSGNLLYNTVIWGNRHDKGGAHNVYLDANNNSKFINCAVESTLTFNGGNKPSDTTGSIVINANNDDPKGPGFIDPSGRRYALKASSPLINAGYDIALNLYLYTDIIGANRLIGSSIDIGAYEFAE